MMDRISKILLCVGLSVWVALYSLWYFFDMVQLYFLGQSVIMLVVSFILGRQNKWSYLTIIFFALTINQFIDEVLLYGSYFRWSEYMVIPTTLIALIRKYYTQRKHKFKWLKKWKR